MLMKRGMFLLTIFDLSAHNYYYDKMVSHDIKRQGSFCEDLSSFIDFKKSNDGVCLQIEGEEL